MGFHLDVHWDFHVASWHASCLLAMFALLLTQNVLETCCGTFAKEAI
jgi:hypothetical protein